MANLQPSQAPEIPQVPQQGQEQKKATWGEYGKQVYNEQYERWMPWIEDFYLRWFTKDNKASYTTKGMSFPALTWCSPDLVWSESHLPPPPNSPGPFYSLHPFCSPHRSVYSIIFQALHPGRFTDGKPPQTPSTNRKSPA